MAMVRVTTPAMAAAEVTATARIMIPTINPKGHGQKLCQGWGVYVCVGIPFQAIAACKGQKGVTQADGILLI
jgi:hypothetical protein